MQHNILRYLGIAAEYKCKCSLLSAHCVSIVCMCCSLMHVQVDRAHGIPIEIVADSTSSMWAREAGMGKCRKMTVLRLVFTAVKKQRKECHRLDDPTAVRLRPQRSRRETQQHFLVFFGQSHKFPYASPTYDGPLLAIGGKREEKREAEGQGLAHERVKMQYERLLCGFGPYFNWNGLFESTKKQRNINESLQNTIARIRKIASKNENTLKHRKCPIKYLREWNRKHGRIFEQCSFDRMRMFIKSIPATSDFSPALWFVRKRLVSFIRQRQCGRACTCMWQPMQKNQWLSSPAKTKTQVWPTPTLPFNT